MQILSIKCGLTRNLGNCNFEKLEVEVSPSDGQSSAELLVEVKDYLEKALPEGGAGDAKPPLAGGKGKGKKSTGKNENKLTAAQKAAAKRAVAKKLQVDPSEVQLADEPPFDTDDKTTPAEKATPVKVTKADARTAFERVVGSKTLGDLLENFNVFRDPGFGFRNALSKKDWQNVVNKVQDCYKKLTTSESDANVMHDLVAAIGSERNTAKSKA